jgi:glutathione S-transferase
VLRIHRIPFSTNVERVSLAASHKGLEVEWVDHDPEDRSEIRALSGQDLVPVAELDGEVVVDSMRIVERLEVHAPDPPLYPVDPAARAGIDVFVEWFDSVWKRAPNEIDDGLARRTPDEARIAALSAQVAASLDLFEGLLTGSDHLLSDGFGAADACAFPFLKYAVVSPDPGDDEPFHYVLSEHLPLGDGFPRLRDWIARVDARPRA